ncbi:LysR family transcriptional regulator (plasmid) [Rhodococcus erythropolis]|uniref:LysR family transcriptional regulator n=1 Tax=Rhodococcus erythropolis TaxID=1833 RepID=UPI00406BD2EC
MTSGREVGPRSANSPAKASIDLQQIRADDFRYLSAVARTGTRRSAAVFLGVDHTTVSRRIHALEKTLDVRLIERGANGWELTDIGRSVADRARSIEESVQLAVDAALGNSGSSLRGSIRVIAPDGFGTLIVTPALARMRLQHPDLSVELLTATRQLNLYQSGFDVAIAVGSPVNSRLVSETISQYTMGIYATQEYLDAHGSPKTVEDVRDHPVIFFVDSLLQVGDLDLDRHLPGASAKFMSTNIFAHLEATRASGGIGLLPAFMASPYPELVRILPTEVDVRLSFTLAARRESLTNPTVQAVRDAIHAEVSRRRDELLPDK